MSPTSNEPFPWHLGVFDAHCHPTDIMSSIASLPTMKARALTVMGTRAEDQHLVAQVASQHSITSPSPSSWKPEERMIPCFGWHPWFAHAMYLDDPTGSSDTNPGENLNPGGERQDDDRAPLTGDAQIAHYASVLQPATPDPNPSERALFLSLPPPTSFTAFLAHTRKNLETHPYALVGEIGLDRSFRIPEPWTSDALSQRSSGLTLGGREGRKLTRYRCAPAHQKAVFQAQLKVAGEMGRAVSVHGVQAHGMVFESLREVWKGWEKRVVSKRELKKREKEKVQGQEQIGLESGEKGGQGEDGSGREADARPPFPPRVCLHSYSGTPDTWKQYLHPSVPVTFFASFSTAINLGDDLDGPTPQAFTDVVRAVPDDMVLVESDLHTAGEEMDRRLEDIVRRVCEVKGWDLEEGVQRLGRNWRRFVFGEE